jgi:hypothetical protein
VEKPSIFIGSSTEGLALARDLKSLLQDEASVRLWDDDFIPLGSTPIEALIEGLPRFDFALIAFTPDDLVNSRKNQSFVPRDNLVFEAGLFIGAIGRNRTFIISAKGLKLPSDLDGVNKVEYDPGVSNEPLLDRITPGCDKIKRAIRDLGFAPQKTARKVEAVIDEQNRMKETVERLSFVLAHFLPHYEFDHLGKLIHGGPFPYHMHPGFEKEIRHLWELRFIRKRKGGDFKIAQLPKDGDLREWFEATDEGKTYFKFRSTLPAGEPE